MIEPKGRVEKSLMSQSDENSRVLNLYDYNIRVDVFFKTSFRA